MKHTFLKHFSFFVILLFMIQIAKSQVVFMLNCYPGDTPVEDDIYLASDQNGWNPGDESFKMEYKDGFFYYTLPEETEVMDFKFTRGDWQTVECKYDGGDVENRSFIQNGMDTLMFKVENWRDMIAAPAKKHTASPNVKIISDFSMPQLGRKRTIRIYLPDNYDSEKRRYPVIYMHDGQNLFDEYTANSGEWAVDEAIDSIKDANRKAIVVGIDNGGELRMDELSPWENPEYTSGEGDKYARFITETLKPFVDENYRTLKDRENTWIFGSSMGGLISFYAGLKYQDVFGKVGVFSPSFWISEQCYALPEKITKKQGQKIYFLAGEKEGGDTDYDVVSDVRKMIEILKKNGYSDYEIEFVADPEGIHNETFWRKYFPQAYQWLYDHPK